MSTADLNGDAIARLHQPNAALELRIAELTRELADAYEQQAAIGDILKIMSRSAFDLTTVLESVLDHAMKLGDTPLACIYLPAGDLLEVSVFRPSGTDVESVLRRSPVRIDRNTTSGRAAVERRTCHVPDLWADPDYRRTDIQHSIGAMPSILAIPLLREEKLVGVLSLTRTEQQPFTDEQIKLMETFADQAVIAIENTRLFQELQQRLEEQTATGEVLRVISESPTELQKVLDTIARTAARLCAAGLAEIFHVQDGFGYVTARSGPLHGAPVGARGQVNRSTLTGRAIVDRATIHVPDMMALSEAEYPTSYKAFREHGNRSGLSVPLLRGGLAIGAISVRRAEAGPFSTLQIKLLETFADQAVIAISNAELFQQLQERNHSLSEALEQQTATSEILRVISQSPTDLPAVLETIVASAARLCEADDVNLLRRFGDRIRTVTSHGELARMVASWVQALAPDIGGPTGLVLDHGTTTGRGILDREIVHVPNVEAESVEEFPIAHRAMPSLGVRTLLSAPLIREAQGIGAITIYRREVRPFTERQIKLLETFASQAVIAISNAELFQQLEDRNHELSDALAQQTATADVLKVISRSAFDLQRVLDTLAENAAQLCGAPLAFIMEFDGEWFHLAAGYGLAAYPEFGALLREHPVGLNRDTLSGRAGLERRAIHSPDVLADPEYRYSRGQEILGYRSAVVVPMIRNDVFLGVLVVFHQEVHPFTPAQIELVTTFADQGSSRWRTLG